MSGPIVLLIEPELLRIEYTGDNMDEDEDENEGEEEDEDENEGEDEDSH